MAKIQKSGSGKIRVADITLAQLSRGLYRSNATVFKELINNAYDADATEVRINTNFPEFDYISIVDTGNGMPIESFINHFGEKGIGSSIKRRGNIEFSEKFGRPIIGRLGIGMMAIGQICHSFKIESHYYDNKGKGKAYKAEIILTDESIPNLESEIKKELKRGREIDVGEWNYKLIDYDEDKVGFRIYSDDVRGTFRREMNESYEDDSEFMKIPFSLEKIANLIYKNKSVRDCKPYIETIWELCILCPLPYSDSDLSPLNFAEQSSLDGDKNKAINFLKDRQKTLQGYNFKVFFDGIELKKIVRLPASSDIQGKVFFVNYEKEIFENTLNFKGYVFSQISKAIRPFELNGIQIRLRNVGIGGYDRTFLKYYNQIETIRSKWVSGEIFVDVGLESALNIDRDSFNEHEEHYKALQKYIHNCLDNIFDKTKKEAAKNSKIRKEEQLRTRGNILRDYVIESSNGQFKLKEGEFDDKETAVKIDKEKGVVIVNNKTKFLGKQKADQLYKIIEIAYKISQNMPISQEEKYKQFMFLVKKALKELI